MFRGYKGIGMSAVKLFGHQAQRIVAVVALLLSVITPVVVSAYASADTVTSRSIQLSSTSAEATDVTYSVKFTAAQSAGAFRINFCSNSPVVGDTCSAPNGFSTNNADTATSGFTLTKPTVNSVVVAGTVSGTVSVDVTGITNPSAAGSLYARIVTFPDASTATSETETGSDVIDSGGVAMQITDKVNVSGLVQESMTFCVAKAAITVSGCGGALQAPTLKLGQQSGDVIALDADHVSTGDLYAQISTNAAGGAVVNLKSSTACGGMKRVGTADCDIAPALQTGITAGQAKVGVIANPYTTDDTTLGATGAFQVVAGSGYGTTNYALNYSSDNTSGVTSVYGDPFLDTNDAPVNNKSMKLTFGASISNSTPAGNYSTDLSMIATGKF